MEHHFFSSASLSGLFFSRRSVKCVGVVVEIWNGLWCLGVVTSTIMTILSSSTVVVTGRWVCAMGLVEIDVRGDITAINILELSFEAPRVI